MITVALHTAPGSGHSRIWRPRPEVRNWDELVEWFDLDHPADTKNCGAFILGELATDPDTGHPRRRNTSVLNRTALQLDADHAGEDFLARVADALPGTAWCVWSTFSHRLVDADHDGSPRYRLVVPLDRAVTFFEYEALARQVVAAVGADAFDTSTCEAGRLMLRPSAHDRSCYESATAPGAPLAAQEWLAGVQVTERDLETSTAATAEIVDFRLDHDRAMGLTGCTGAQDLERWLAEMSEADERNPTAFRLGKAIAGRIAAGCLAADALDRLAEVLEGRRAPGERSGEWEGMLPRIIGGITAEPCEGCGELRLAETSRDLFETTATLGHIRTAAHSIGRSALPMLAFVLARVLAEVDPQVVLPGGQDGAVGRRASLNLGFAFVGDPGKGKTDISEMSEELLGIDQGSIQRAPSTGEGLIQSYLEIGPTKQHQLVPTPRRLFNVDEIEQLTRSGNRNGATLGPIMRAMLTGGHVGTENANQALRRNLPARSYRMVLCVGVQPSKAGALLEEEGSGLPQRFVWVPVGLPDVPHPDERPEWPGVLPVRRLDFVHGLIDYPDRIKRQVRLEDWARARGETDVISGHLTLTRLKVAAALALLHGDDRITEQWWLLAGEVIDLSEAEVASVKAQLDRDRDRAGEVAYRRERETQRRVDAEIRETELERAVRTVAKNLETRLGKEPSATWAEVRPPHQYRQWDGATEDIIEELHAVPWLAIEEYTARNGRTAYRFTKAGTEGG